MLAYLLAPGATNFILMNIRQYWISYLVAAGVRGKIGPHF